MAAVSRHSTYSTATTVATALANTVDLIIAMPSRFSASCPRTGSTSLCPLRRPVPRVYFTTTVPVCAWTFPPVTCTVYS